MSTISSAAHAADEGNSPEMDAILAAALKSEGVAVTKALPPGNRRSSGVDVVVSYVDVWRWDLSMYLQSLSVRLFDAATGDLLAQGKWRDSDLHGFRDPQLVMQGLVAEMLAKVRSVAPGNAASITPMASRPPSPRVDSEPEYIPSTGSRWVSVEGSSELRAIYSDTVIRGRVYGRNTAQGTPYVGEFRSNGTGVVTMQGRSAPRTWEIKGNDMVCTRAAQSSDCYRLERNASNRDEYRGRHVSRDLSVQFVVERKGRSSVANVPRSDASGPLRESDMSEEPLLSGYTCCNLHYNKDAISDANWSSLPMLPAGTPMSILNYSGYRINVLVDHGGIGRKMSLHLDYGRSQRVGDWARRMIVKVDPKRDLATWPVSVRDAIRDGKISLGMTKEQVIVALGYPPAHETTSLDSDRWKYWYGRFDPFVVSWDDSGRVRDVIAEPPVRAAVLLPGSNSTVGR